MVGEDNRMDKQKELAKNTIILTVGKICTQFVSFLLLPLYTALLAPEDYGAFDLMNTYISVLIPIFNWQFENGLFRFMMDCRDDSDKQKELFSTVIIANMLQSLIYLVFYFVIERYISSPYKIYLAIDVVINIFLNTLLQFPRGLGKNGDYALASFVSATSTIVFNVLLIFVLRKGIWGMFIATIVGKTVSLLYLVISQKAWRYFSIRRFSTATFKKVSKYSLPLVPNQLSWWTISISDRLIVSHILGLAANGVYSIANKFSSLYITVYNIFNMSWTESVTIHVSDEDRDEFMTETINSMFLLFGCACVGIIAVMPIVFSMMVNEQYQAAYNQIPILMIAVLFQVIVGLYSVIYVAMKRSVDIAKTSFYAAIINISTNLLLVKWIGLYAASVSTLLAYATMAIYRYFHVKRYINIGLRMKNIFSISLMTGITVLAYYRGNIIVKTVILIVVAIYSIILNWSFFKSSFEMVKAKVNFRK